MTINERTCAFCGASFVPNTIGRPSQYCSKDCRDTISAFWLFQSRLLAVLPRMTDEKFKELRGATWSLTNSRGVNNVSGSRLSKAARWRLVCEAVAAQGGELTEFSWSASDVHVVIEFPPGVLSDGTVSWATVAHADEQLKSERLREDAMLTTLLEQIQRLEFRSAAN